jgi:hypothetical protein
VFKATWAFEEEQKPTLSHAMEMNVLTPDGHISADLTRALGVLEDMQESGELARVKHSTAPGLPPAAFGSGEKGIAMYDDPGRACSWLKLSQVKAIRPINK